MPPSAKAAPPPDPPRPPYYEAVADLYLGHPDAGAMPVLAYRPGDRVVPQAVDEHGWQDRVTVPAWFAAGLPAEPEAAGEPPG